MEHSSSRARPWWPLPSAPPWGSVARGTWPNQTVKAAQDKAARIVAEARAQQKDMILEAKDEKLRLQREAEEEARAKRAELQNLERRLLARDEQLDQRADMLEEKSRKINDRERDIEHQRESWAGSSQERVAALEQVSGLSAEDAKGILLEAIREEAEHDAVKLSRSIERRARDEAHEKAREIIVTAMQRVAADHTAEHTVTVVHLPSDEMKGRIIGREGRNIRALEQATGVDLIIDDTPETVVLSGFDPVRREIARLALTKLIADGRIHPGRIEEVVNKARAEVDLVIRQAGEQAVYDAGVPGLPPELVKLLGPAQVPHQLRPERARPLRRDEPPRRDHRRGAGRRRPGGQDRRPAARHRQGRRPRGRGPARRHRRGDRPEAQPAVQGRQRASRRTTRRSSTPASRRRSSRSPTRSPRRGPAPAARRWRPTSSASRTSRRSRRASPAWSARSPSRPGREVRILVRPEEIDDLTASRLARDIVKKIEDSLDVPGPDQGDGDPRDAGRRVREVGDAHPVTAPQRSGRARQPAQRQRAPAPGRLPDPDDRRRHREARAASPSSRCCRACATSAASTS